MNQAPTRTVIASAVYGMDLLPGDGVVGALPAYGGVEMLAGQLRSTWIEGSRVPLTDPAAYWDVAIRVSRTVPRHELVAMLLALAGAIETGRMPGPEEVADHPVGQLITVRPDPAPTVERD
jgi:hypothetical protein